MTSIGIVIVSFNTRELLRDCLVSLRGCALPLRVVVVENASRDGSAVLVRESFPDVELIELAKNVGFAAGTNVGLRRLGVRSQESGIGEQTPTPNPQLPTPDYVFLLNPDTEVVGDAIPALVRYLEAHPHVALVGPQLRYPDGSVQPSRRRFPTRGVFFWESTPLEQRWPNNPWARRYRIADTADDAEQEVDWLVGAALMVRRDAIERAGLLDAGFVMYSEELEWQRRIRGIGVGSWGMGGRYQPPTPNSQLPRIVYFPDAVVIHHEGKSSEQAPARRYLNFQRSRLRDAGLVYGERFAALLRVFLRASYAAELAAEGLKWLIGHKRTLRARRVAVYWQVLREL